jgi:putative endonuclease
VPDVCIFTATDYESGHYRRATARTANPAASGMLKPGQLAEQRAADYLRARGLKLVEKNYHCRFGEIDLILRDGATLVFVEVRSRASSQFGGAAASIDARKQHKLVATAQHYLASLPRTPPCRFDALLLQGDQIEWLQNAFEA